jgi:hypothetical protein
LENYVAIHNLSFPCPTCGHSIDAVSNIDDKDADAPNPGDLTACPNCGAILAFDNSDSRVHVVTPEERAENEDAYFRIYQLAWRAKTNNKPEIETLPPSVLDVVEKTIKTFRDLFERDTNTNKGAALVAARLIDEELIVLDVIDPTGLSFFLPQMMHGLVNDPDAPANGYVFSNIGRSMEIHREDGESTASFKERIREANANRNDESLYEQEVFVVAANFNGYKPLTRIFNIDREAGTLTEKDISKAIATAGTASGRGSLEDALSQLPDNIH